MSHSPTPPGPWRWTPFRAASLDRHIPRRASRAPRRLPRGIGLTLALIVSLGMWAALAYAVTWLFGLL
jgi:hypothetical protein